MPKGSKKKNIAPARTPKKSAPTYQALTKALDAYATAAKAKSSAWFFKTGKGQYGEGDTFIGVTVPEQRLVAKTFKEASFDVLAKMLLSPIHEHRLTALLILDEQFAAHEGKRNQIFDFYFTYSTRINNWDLVDSSARDIVGAYLYQYMPLLATRSFLDNLAHARSLWERRIAIVSTHYFILKGNYTLTLRMCDLLMEDKEDLIHKACGWMLREVGKHNGKTSETVLRRYLDANAGHMPRTMLRYAIERLDAKSKKRYMAL